MTMGRGAHCRCRASGSRDQHGNDQGGAERHSRSRLDAPRCETPHRSFREHAEGHPSMFFEFKLTNLTWRRLSQRTSACPRVRPQDLPSGSSYNEARAGLFEDP